MFEKLKNFSEDKRGLVGIGTLIIFIAMVIVAAVAAGVLINTSQSLQEQARATGEETIREVSSGVQVNAVKGETNVDAEFNELEVVVSTYPGSDGVNLEQTAIQVMTPDEMEHLTYDDEEFEVSKIENVSDTQETMLGPGDTVQVSIDLEDVAAGETLESGDSASLTFIPAEGFDTYYGVNVPNVLRDETWYEL